MDGPIPAGVRVQIRYRVLAPEERARGLPADTAGTSYLVRVNGILESSASLGENATVRTAVGRSLSGELVVIEPADSHTFGRPVPALVATIDSIRALTREV